MWKWLIPASTALTLLAGMFVASERTRWVGWVLAGLALLALLTPLALEAIHRGRRREGDWLKLLAASPTRVAHTRPYDLGVNREALAVLKRLPARRATYVARDEDERLHATVSALIGAGYGGVVVSGGPNVGKTRSLHAALIAEVPEALLIVPRDRSCFVALVSPVSSGDSTNASDSEGPPPLLSIARQKSARCVVVFLENLEDFLIGESAARVHDLVERGLRNCPIPVVVAATLGGHGGIPLYGEHVGDDSVDIAANVLSSLAATTFQWRASLSRAEARRLDEILRGLADEVERAGGIGRFFVEPGLVDARLESFRRHDPRAWDLMNAALAWHQAGTRSAIAPDALRALWEGAFSSRTYVPSETEFKTTLERCLEPIRETAQALRWSTDGVWADEHLVHQRWGSDPLAAEQWEAILIHCDADQALGLGLTAVATPRQSGERQEQERRALRAFARSASLGNDEAASLAASIHLRAGRDDEAERLLRPWVPQSAFAATTLARLLRRRGDVDASVTLLEQAPQTDYVTAALVKSLRDRELPGDLDRVVALLTPRREKRFFAEPLVFALLDRGNDGDGEVALEIAESFVGLPVVTARVHDRLGRTEKALALLLPLSHQLVEGTAAAAILLRRRAAGDEVMAIEVLKPHAANSVAACMLADVLAENEDVQSHARAKELLRAHPRNPNAQLQLARLLVEDEPDAEETDALLRALTSARHYDSVYTLDVTTVLLRRGRPEDHVAVIALLSPRASAHRFATRLAKLYSEIGRGAEAVPLLVPHVDRPNAAALLQRVLRGLTSEERETVLAELRVRESGPEVDVATALCLIARQGPGDLEDAEAILHPHIRFAPARHALLEMQCRSSDVAEVVRAAAELLALRPNSRTDAIASAAVDQLARLLGNRGSSMEELNRLSGDDRAVIDALVDRAIPVAQRYPRTAVALDRLLRAQDAKKEIELRVNLLRVHATDVIAVSALANALRVRNRPGDLDEAISIAEPCADSNSYCAVAAVRALTLRHSAGDIDRARIIIEQHPTNEFVQRLRRWLEDGA